MVVLSHVVDVVRGRRCESEYRIVWIMYAQGCHSPKLSLVNSATSMGQGIVATLGTNTYVGVVHEIFPSLPRTWVFRPESSTRTG